MTKKELEKRPVRMVRSIDVLDSVLVLWKVKMGFYQVMIKGHLVVLMMRLNDPGLFCLYL